MLMYEEVAEWFRPAASFVPAIATLTNINRLFLGNVASRQVVLT